VKCATNELAETTVLTMEFVITELVPAFRDSKALFVMRFHARITAITEANVLMANVYVMKDSLVNNAKVSICLTE